MLAMPPLYTDAEEFYGDIRGLQKLQPFSKVSGATKKTVKSPSLEDSLS
jgi:hypothetical protein